MLSLEQPNPNQVSSVPSSKYLNHKLELFTNKLKESLEKIEKKEKQSWAVVNFSGEILASGLSAHISENPEYLF